MFVFLIHITHLQMHTHKLTHTLTHSLARSLSLTLSLSHTHTHTHTYTHTHTHTHTHTPQQVTGTPSLGDDVLGRKSQKSARSKICYRKTTVVLTFESNC